MGIGGFSSVKTVDDSAKQQRSCPATTVGSSSSSPLFSSRAGQPQPDTAVTKLRREFDRLFAEMEFRCKRSALMNYDEAERYDNSAKWLQRVSAVLATAGVSGVVISVAKTRRVAASRSGVYGILALPVSAMLEFFSQGSSTLAPTATERARLHVRAGAGWQRVGRLSRLYRLQLRHLPDDAVVSGALSVWYRELVEACEQVSVILPIRAEVYSRYEAPELVRGRVEKRELLLQRYLDLQRAAGPSIDLTQSI